MISITFHQIKVAACAGLVLSLFAAAPTAEAAAPMSVGPSVNEALINLWGDSPRVMHNVPRWFIFKGNDALINRPSVNWEEKVEPMSFDAGMSDHLFKNSYLNSDGMSEMLWSAGLIRENLKIWRCVGHQTGRLDNIRRGKPDIGDGPCRRMGPIRF